MTPFLKPLLIAYLSMQSPSCFSCSFSFPFFCFFFFFFFFFFSRHFSLLLPHLNYAQTPLNPIFQSCIFLHSRQSNSLLVSCRFPGPLLRLGSPAHPSSYQNLSRLIQDFSSAHLPFRFRLMIPSTSFIQSIPLKPSQSHSKFNLSCNLTLPSRVIVTAPAHTASSLASKLITHSIRPIILPTLKTRPISDSRIDILQDAVLRLHQYHVITLITPAAISALSSHLLSVVENNPEAAYLALQASQVQLAALPQHAAIVKQHLSRQPDIIPLYPSVDALAAFLKADPLLEAASLLCPVPVYVGMQQPSLVPHFLNLLHESGFQTTAAPSYEVSPVNIQSVQPELSLLPSADAILFSSAAEVFSFITLLTPSQHQTLTDRLSNNHIFMAAYGPDAASAITQIFGIASIQSDDHPSFEAFVRFLANQITRRKSQGKLLFPS